MDQSRSQSQRDVGPSLGGGDAALRTPSSGLDQASETQISAVEKSSNPTRKDASRGLCASASAHENVLATFRAQGRDQDQDQGIDSMYIDPKEEAKLLRKLDCWIGITIGILFLMSYLDRSNIGNAFSAGLAADLSLPSDGVNVCTSLFYVTYVLLEAPSAMLFKRIGARIIIPAIVVAWGLCTLFTGFVSSYGGLIATRLVLGAVESGLFPILAVYLTFFYKRSELGRRTSYLFVAAAISGAFGGILAYGIFHMDGVGGKHGWQWLYILEGLVTVILGAASYFVLANDYESAWYLNARDKEIMRIREKAARVYQGPEEEKFNWAEARAAFQDPKVWISGLSQFGGDSALFGLSTFLPVIVQSFDSSYTTLQVQLLTIPVYAWAAACYIAVAAFTDRYGHRAATLCTFATVSVVGFAILLGSQTPGVLYFACFLAACGLYIIVGLNVSYLTVNLAPQLKRATGSGLQLTLGNSGGIVAGQIYRSKDKPRYIPGYSASLGLVAMAGIGYVISAVYMASMNEARDAVQAEEAKDRMGASGGGLGQEARARNEQAAQEAEKAGNEQKVQVQASDELEANTGGGAVRRRTRGAWFVAGTGAKSDLGDRTVGFRYLL